ncbi:MAG: TMEM175 family protein [Acidimicrobiia bacterium]
MSDEPAEEILDDRFERHSRGLEFDRVAFFSDAVFAIAMTLLVVGIGIPHVRDAHLTKALGDKDAEIFSFFLSFVVIGFYWLGHHRFFATLQRVDRRFMQLNLLYLAAIAFMPFPTALVGSYGNRAVAVVLYAVTLATASALEAVLLWRAHAKGFMRVRLTPEGFRWSMLASLAPVVIFLASIPVAYLVSSDWALYVWILIFPTELIIDRLERPDQLTE